jgi:hypothetical protein
VWQLWVDLFHPPLPVRLLNPSLVPLCGARGVNINFSVDETPLYLKNR